LDGRKATRVSMSGTELWRNRQTKGGGSMKLTLLGMVAIFGIVTLLTIITEYLRGNLVAANMSGEEHDDRR
jgi:hypothetical protein